MNSDGNRVIREPIQIPLDRVPELINGVIGLVGARAAMDQARRFSINRSHPRLHAWAGAFHWWYFRNGRMVRPPVGLGTQVADALPAAMDYWLLTPVPGILESPRLPHLVDRIQAEGEACLWEVRHAGYFSACGLRVVWRSLEGLPGRDIDVPDLGVEVEVKAKIDPTTATTTDDALLSTLDDGAGQFSLSAANVLIVYAPRRRDIEDLPAPENKARLRIIGKLHRDARGRRIGRLGIVGPVRSVTVRGAKAVDYSYRAWSYDNPMSDRPVAAALPWFTRTAEAR